MSGPGVTAQVKLQSSMLNSFNGFSGIGSPFNINASVVNPFKNLPSALSPLITGAAQLIIHPLEYGSMFQDRAGTIPVTESGQLVGHVLDVGGGNFHATAVSDAARGIFYADTGTGGVRIRYNGVNTAYQTPVLPAPGVDKAQVFFSMTRHNSSFGMIVELSPNSGTYNGSLAIFEGGTYQARSRGTSTVTAIQSGTQSRWTKEGITALFDISGRLIRLRKNGTQIASSTESQGTGNYNSFGEFRLNLGARQNGSFYLAGDSWRTLGPITRFSAANATEDQIAAAEAYYT